MGSDGAYVHKDEKKIGSVLDPGIKEQLEASQSKAPADFGLPRAKARLLKGVHHFNISHPRAEDRYGYESTAQRYYNADSTFGTADAEAHRQKVLTRKMHQSNSKSSHIKFTMGKLPVKDHYRSINKSLQNGEGSLFDSAEHAPAEHSPAEAQASPGQQLSQYQQARMTKQAITKMNKSSNINIENGGREFLTFAGAKSHVQDTYQHHKLA